jgi:hypothetical protein
LKTQLLIKTDKVGIDTPPAISVLTKVNFDVKRDTSSRIRMNDRFCADPMRSDFTNRFST